MYKRPPLSARGSGKAAAMALRAPCNGIQIKEDKQQTNKKRRTYSSLTLSVGGYHEGFHRGRNGERNRVISSLH